MTYLSKKSLQTSLAERHKQHLYRTRKIVSGAHGVDQIVDGKAVVAFCSNDYLGLANHPSVIKSWQQGANDMGVGSGASHLICGHNEAHHALEEALATFLKRERALLFSTGYMANIGVITALLSKGDHLYEDRLNHASLLDAARLSRAHRFRYDHCNPTALQQRFDKQRLDNSRTSGTHKSLIVTDGVFSMDGDIAPLPQLCAIARQQHAWLMVDDAHGIGVLGPEGQGSVAHWGLSSEDVPILMGTLGKSCGVFGAFIAGNETLIETLIQYARTYAYTTALPPALACAAHTSLKLLASESWRRDKLNQLIQRFRHGAAQLGIALSAAVTPIQPIIIGNSDKALQVSESLLAAGFLVTAIRPPTVAEGSARLRITFSANHTELQIDALLLALEKCL